MPRTPTPHTQYRHQSNRHTNVPDYEKERRVPEDRYSPPGRDVGLWVEEEYTMRRGRSSANTSPRQADHDMPYTTLSDNTTPTSRNPGLNIWTEASKTSPTSNLETASYHTKRISPQEKSRSPILLPDDIYDRHRTEGDNRRDTLCYEEPRIFKPLPSTNDDTVSCRSLPCSAYSVPRLAKDNSDNASLDNYLPSRYSQNASGSFSSSQLRKSHQELTDETMRHHTPSHHRSPSLRSVNEQLRGGDPYRSLVPPHDHMTYLQANRHSHSTSDLVTSRTPTSMSDLSTWQQLHKQQLALQKADTKTLSSINSKSASLNNLHGFDPVSVPNIAGVYNNHHTIGAFRNAADEIIQEKDKVIEDLRIQLMQLEGSNHYPSGYSSLPLRSPGGTEISNLKQHVQDLEFQNSLLKSRLDEISKSQKSNIKSLELKLGATEHELMSVKSDLSSKQKRSRFESVEVEQKLMEKDNEIQEWQRRYVEMRDDRTEVKRKLDGLQRYLSDLPTAEDSSATERHVAELEEKVSTQTTTIEGLEKKLMTTSKVISSQALELKNLEKQKSELTSQLSTVQDELNTIKTNGLGEELASAQHQIGQLKRDKDRVKIELEKSKKMLGDRHQLAKRAEMRHQLEVKKLEERVQQEESVVTALREESSNNEAHMAKLKQAIKELSTQNQDLMEQTMIQRESLAKFDRQCTEESQKVERQLAREMRQCFAELQSLVRVCMDRAEGNDPDINLVLGTGGIPEVESDDEYSQSSQSGSSSQASSNSGRGALTDALTLKHRLTKVRELRGDVDKLRAVISDKIAADLGKRIECAMQ